MWPRFRACSQPFCPDFKRAASQDARLPAWELRSQPQGRGLCGSWKDSIPGALSGWDAQVCEAPPPALMSSARQATPALPFSREPARGTSQARPVSGGASVKEPACQCSRLKRCGFESWVQKIPWRRKWQPTSVFLPGESPWTEEPRGLWSIGSQRVGHD